MEHVGGPRDHLANERTHLAWLRTALAVMVLGLAVAKFGDNGAASPASITAGGVLLVTGMAAVVYGSARYRSTARELSQRQLGTPRSTTGPVAAAGILMVAVLVAAMILFLGD